ncbi:MAG: DUF3991 and toprim domain-containing protein [Lachnospiraceae bacterium]|nr:DUF3991 and toprim domain-containing protein [Lachnospiraceae bacterium]
MARGTIKRFSDEQVERANRVDVVDYAKSLGYEIERSGIWYKAKGKGGLYFNRPKNTWHWETQDVGGGGAISLCMKLENKTWVEAVKTLLGEEMNEIRHTQDWKPEPEQKKEFNLPSRNDTYRHVFAYLGKTRGIDEEIIKDMVAQRLIYENTQRSCVFVGRDKEGVARHASVRSTNTAGKVFKQDVPGSQKQFSFSLSGTSGTLNVFEAPIDMLSYMTLQKEHGLKTDDSYVALGGVTDKALIRFLEEYPDIKKIRICTDHDEAGENAAIRIYEEYHERYKITRHRPSYKDFNEDLVALKYPERVKAKEQDIENEVQADNHKEQAQDGRESEKQDAEREDTEQIKQNFQLSKKELLKLGIEQRTIAWYMDAEKECVDEMFSIKGNSNLLYVYDSQEELVADVDMGCRLWDKFQEDIEVAYREEYPHDEYRAAYQGVRQMKDYILTNPQISQVFVKTSRMDTGKRAAEEIKALCDELGIKCDRMEPKLMTFAEDLAMENAVTEIIEQTPLNDLQSLQNLDMAAGMEM